jgi:hypothetical protein
MHKEMELFRFGACPRFEGLPSQDQMLQNVLHDYALGQYVSPTMFHRGFNSDLGTGASGRPA